jgi:hypothetical protein
MCELCSNAATQDEVIALRREVGELHQDVLAVKEILSRWDTAATEAKEKFSDPGALTDMLMGMMGGGKGLGF